MKSRLFLLKAELDKNASEELKSKYIRTSDARNYNLAFVDVINGQIREIRKTKLLQKREMRKDIVIELSYKGFSRASDYS